MPNPSHGPTAARDRSTDEVASAARAAAPAARIDRPAPASDRARIGLGWLAVALAFGAALGAAVVTGGAGADSSDCPSRSSAAGLHDGGSRADELVDGETALPTLEPVDREPSGDEGVAASGMPTAPASVHRGPLGWIALGGGVDPISNQISMEQDLRLAQQVLGAVRGGVTFYGAARAPTLVQVRDARKAQDELTAALASLFDPRPERSARYRPSVLVAEGPSARGPFLARLVSELQQPVGEPLVTYVAAHGDVGERPRDNSIAFWGGEPLRVSDLAGRLEASPGRRPLLLVASSCFSGGFADIVFSAARPERGASSALRCGLFASTWDREAEGCDPDPDRRVQESYGLHFLNALRGADREGHPVPAGELDLDGDGRISASEAHTRVRIASRSISVPTSSSERWLREVAPVAGPERAVLTPEDDAVILGLGPVLGASDRARALARHQSLVARADQLDGALDEAEATLDASWQALVSGLLTRWPVIDDPWHPDFPATVHAYREPIAALLASSDEALAYRAAERDADRLAERLDDVEVEIALLERLVRAFDNRTMAARLRALGGRAFDRYEQLRACERSWPPEAL